MLPAFNLVSNPNYYAVPPDSTPLQLLSVTLITKEQIAFIGDLGEGCFGRVYKGSDCIPLLLTWPYIWPLYFRLGEYQYKCLNESDDGSDSGNSSAGGDTTIDIDPKEKKFLKTRIVAVKILKEFTGGETEGNFMREVEIMANFRHPNILSLIGVVMPGKEELL